MTQNALAELGAPSGVFFKLGMNFQAGRQVFPAVQFVEKSPHDPHIQERRSRMLEHANFWSLR
jgi:hypothetical protein